MFFHKIRKLEVLIKCDAKHFLVLENNNRIELILN